MRKGLLKGFLIFILLLPLACLVITYYASKTVDNTIKQTVLNTDLGPGLKLYWNSDPKSGYVYGIAKSYATLFIANTEGKILYIINLTI